MRWNINLIIYYLYLNDNLLEKCILIIYQITVKLLLLLKKVSIARLGGSDIHPISPKTPAPQYQPIDRKKRKGKRVEDYRRNRAA